MHSVMGGHIAVVTPLPVLKESAGTPTTISPCSTASSAAAVASSLLQQPDCAAAAAGERPAGTTMITFSCEKRLFPKKQIMAASASAAIAADYVPIVADDESDALFYSSRTNL